MSRVLYANDTCVIYQACLSGSFPSNGDRFRPARFLINNGGKLNGCDYGRQNSYLSAIYFKNLEIIKYFCDKNSVDIDGRGPFHLLLANIKSETAALEIFEYLTSEGVNMNIIDSDGSQALSYQAIETSKHKLIIESYLKNEENIKLMFEDDLGKLIWEQVKENIQMM